MSTFKDAKQRDWKLSLDAPTIREVRARCDVDLIDTEGKALAEMAADFCKLVDVLWVMCEKQAKALSPAVTETEFGESLVGDALMHAATALTDAIVDFFPSDRGKLMRAVASKTTSVQAVGIQSVLAKVNDPELEAKLLKKIDSEVDSVLQRLTQ